uniref:SCAN domain-containing protein 3-like n=1 Tax=Diabrotica virgifera virgifera TaxID=50390 RepID=A0A6P7G1Y5_DIAVI
MWDMFELTNNCNVEPNMSDLFLKSLSKLNDYQKVFPSLDTSSMDWVRNPYIESAYDTALFTTDEEGELINIKKNDRGLKLKYSKLVEEAEAQSKLRKIKVNVDIASFWILLFNEYPLVTKKAMNAIIPFSTSYICESAFSSMNAIKNKNRSQLKSLEDGLRMCLSTIRPRKDLIMKGHQAEVSQ